MNKKKNFQPFYVKFGYGIGNLGYGVISQTVTNFYMFYGTAVLGLSGSVIGFIIAISTVWDGVSDCFIGGLSDKVKIGKLGHRNGYMLIATIGMSVINVLLWNVPNSSYIIKYIWIGVGLLLLETFNTMFSTPYMALGNDIATSANNKTLLQIYKTIGFLIAIIIPSALMFIFLPSTEKYPVGQLNPKGYISISLASSVICLVAGLMSVFLTLKKSKERKIENENNSLSIKSLFLNFYSTLKVARIRKLIIGYALAQIPSVILTGLGMHFFTYCFLCDSRQITVLLLSLILGMLVSQPLWFYLSKKTDRKQALMNSIFVAIIGVFCIIFVYIFRFSLLELSFYISIFATFVCGFGSGGLYALPLSLYGDEIDNLNKKSKENKTATYSGALTLFSNLASSIMLFVVGLMLDLVGFNAKEQIQPLLVQTFLAVTLFVGVVAAFISAGVLFYSYDLKKHEKSKLRE